LAKSISYVEVATHQSHSFLHLIQLMVVVVQVWVSLLDIGPLLRYVQVAVANKVIKTDLISHNIKPADDDKLDKRQKGPEQSDFNLKMKPEN